ncbi:MAG: 2-hydroxyacid dehydrogenase [Bacillota bacterium]
MTRHAVFVTRRLPDEAIAVLRTHFDVRMWPEADEPISRDALLREASNADALLCLLTEKVDRDLLEAAPRLRIVANMAVGYDNVDVPACTERGIVVTNTPGVLTESTADLALALILAAGRRLPEAMRVVAEDRWRAWSPMFLTGQDVHGSTLGIVGLGRIGQAVAQRARGFGMRILYYSRNRAEDAESKTGAEYCSLDDLLRESDFVSLHLPLTQDTFHLIGERELGLMKPTAVLVNTSRGPVVDEDALYRALSAKKIWAAGLDVFEREPLPMDSPLRTLDNVVLLPHIGSASVATRVRMAALAAENIREYLLRGRPVTPVNPEAVR